MIQYIINFISYYIALIVLPTLKKKTSYDINLSSKLADSHDLVLKQIEHLETVVIQPKFSVEKVMIIVLGNGRRIPDFFDIAEHFAGQINANICLFHYRGVGKSTGFPKSKKDLVEDLHIIVNYWNFLGFSNNKITIYGHSLGGAIAAKASGNYEHSQKPFLIIDRSFGQISKVAAFMFVGAYKSSFWLAKYILESFSWEINIIKDLKSYPKDKILVFNLSRCGCDKGSDKKIPSVVDLASEKPPILVSYLHGKRDVPFGSQHSEHPAHVHLEGSEVTLLEKIVTYINNQKI